MGNNLTQNSKSRTELYTEIKQTSVTNGNHHIADITHIDHDQCASHYDKTIVPYESNRCEIKFLDNYNDNIKRHNEGEICLSGCTYHYKDRISVLYNVVKFATEFLKKRDVEWCFYYGGLVGLYTSNELLPWDPDIDIIINTEEVNKLSNFENEDYVFNIDPSKLYKGEVIGRFIDKQTGLYTDITYYFKKNGNVYVKKMLTKTNKNHYSVIPYNKFYPIKYRSFKNGITVPVPSDILYNLTQRYGKISPHYKLDNDTYIKI